MAISDERVGKLSVVVEGTFMRMLDLLLPRNAARSNTLFISSQQSRKSKTV
jgi:hypothetical protein